MEPDEQLVWLGKQFAIAVQNVIKIDENFLNLSKKRSKAIKFITDCLTVAGTRDRLADYFRPDGGAAAAWESLVRAWHG